MDISKFVVSSRMTSAAVDMCRSLGYHRIPRSHLDASRERRAFWTTYILDKAVSLRIGRTSILQDCDISTELPPLPPEEDQRPWHSMYLSWISLAKLQGRIYQDLFTVQALADAPEARTERAQKLVAALRLWYEDCYKVRSISMVIEFDP